MPLKHTFVSEMADTEIIVAITFIIVAAFYIVEILIHLAVMLYQWYIGGETEKYDVEGNTSQPPEFGGEKTEDLNYWWKIRCAQVSDWLPVFISKGKCTERERSISKNGTWRANCRQPQGLDTF